MQQCNHRHHHQHQPIYLIRTTTYRLVNPEDLVEAETSAAAPIAPETVADWVSGEEFMARNKSKIQKIMNDPMAQAVERQYLAVQNLNSAMIRMTRAVQKLIRPDSQVGDTFFVGFPMMISDGAANDALKAVLSMRTGDLSPEEAMAVVEKAMKDTVDMRALSTLEESELDTWRDIDRGYYLLGQVLLRDNLVTKADLLRSEFEGGRYMSASGSPRYQSRVAAKLSETAADEAFQTLRQLLINRPAMFSDTPAFVESFITSAL